MDLATRTAALAGSGDRHALARFVQLTQADVWRLCAYLGRGFDPDDLTQETYERALASLPRFRGESSARTWLLGIARRVCADHIRRAGRERAAVARLVDPTPMADPADSIALQDLLAGLDDDRRAAFVLTQIIGLAYVEAAEALGCPIGTIRSRVARARAELLASVHGSGFGTGAWPRSGGTATASAVAARR